MCNNFNMNPDNEQSSEQDYEFWRGCFILVCYVLAFIVAAIACLFLTSCSPRVIESIAVRTDTIRLNRTMLDSVWVHDSVYVREWTDRDTVRIETTHWRDKWRERVITDTAYISRCDTVIRTVTSKQQCTLSGWQWFQIWAGRLAMLAIAVTLVIFIAKKYMILFLPK